MQNASQNLTAFSRRPNVGTPCDDDGEDDCFYLHGDLQRFLERRLGYSRFPDNELIPITVVYSVLFLTGMLGNGITIFVISHVRYMHTATNLYLVNLAVTDILSLTLSMTHELITCWIYYPYPFTSTVCKLRALIAETATAATVLTIMAVTVERYIAICRPLLLNSNESSTSLRRSVKVIITIWICSCLAAVPITLHLDVVYLEAPFGNGTVIPQSATCRIEKLEEFDFSDRVWLVSFVSFFVVPLTVLTVLYILIGRAIRRAEHMYDQSDIAKIHAAYRRSQDERCTTSTNLGLGASLLPSTTIATCALPACTDSRLLKQKVKARRGVVRMLVAVVVGFFVCWAPYNVERLVTMLAPKGSFTDETFYTVHRHLFLISGVLFYVSSTINPLLYVASSARFRRATKLALRVLVLGCSRRQPSASAYAQRAYRSNCRVNLLNKSVKNQQQLRAKGRLRSLCGGAALLRLPNGIEPCAQSEPLMRNINVQIPPLMRSLGNPQGTYQVCKFTYRFPPASVCTTYQSMPIPGNCNCNYNCNGNNKLLLTPTRNYKKRSATNVPVIGVLMAQAGSSKGGKQQTTKKKKKLKGETQRDCVSLGELELNSRYLAPGNVSRNSSSDSSERRPITLN